MSDCDCQLEIDRLWDEIRRIDEAGHNLHAKYREQVRFLSWRTEFLDYGDHTIICKVDCDDDGNITTPCSCGFSDLQAAALNREKP